MCACVRVPGALQNSSVPPQAARVTLVKRFHSFHVMKISAFQNLTKMCKYQCEILMNGHLFDMLFLSVEVFRQASCNVANLRSGAESAELATHWQCLSCVSCASYNALFACVHVLLSPTKSSQANSECNFKAALHSRREKLSPRRFSETCRELADQVSNAGVVSTTETMPFAVSKVGI